MKLSERDHRSSSERSQGGADGIEVGTSQHFFVGNLLLPDNFKDTTETSEVEMMILLY